jgi:hypothetical protein
MNNDKTWAEKITLATCRCGHTNTIHAGGTEGCAFLGCACCEFKERMTPVEPPSAFQEVKEIMQSP